MSGCTASGTKDLSAVLARTVRITSSSDSGSLRIRLFSTNAQAPSRSNLASFF